MNFIKTHWFGLITGIIIFFFFILFILVLLSPRQDNLRRGFIPCTETMAENLLSCEENKFICLIKSVVKNSWCDIKVVGKGIKLWLKGEQTAPWSNYIFVPELTSEEEYARNAKIEYHKNNSDVKQEMQELKKLNEELENEQNAILPQE